MPELPEIVVYVEALADRILGRPLQRVQLRSPFFLRSVDPPLEAVCGATVRDVFRIGKRITLGLAARGAPRSRQPVSSITTGLPGEDLYLVIHLMIAGRFRWREPGQAPGIGPRLLLASLEFPNGTLLITEAGSKKRASMHLLRGHGDLQAVDRGGVEPLGADLPTFREALTRESHTLKRALTDPRLFSGIGNAFSDEILHAARLSPLKLTRSISEDEIARLWTATRETLETWVDRLRREAAGKFPEKVTAFHKQMAVHGRFKEPCPVCGSPVQRIVYAENECNYCATCQTGGRLLADRALSRLIR